MKKAILIVLILSLFTACSKKNDTENAEMTTSSSITSEVSEAEEKTAEDVLSETVKTAESSKPLQPTPQEDELDAMLANAFSEDSVFEYQTEDNEIRIEKYNGNSKEAVIPPTINGLPVTKVSVSAFEKSSVETLTIPGTIQNFNFMTKLKKLVTLNFSSAPESFGVDSFLYLMDFKAINVNGDGDYKTIDGVIYTDDGKTLVLCPRGRTEELVIPEGVESCTKKAFFHSDITSVVVPESMTDISTFSNCPAIETLTVKGNLSEFKSTDFIRCQKLKAINIEGDGEYFSQDGIIYTDGGKKLVYCPIAKSGSFTVPDTVEVIGNNAFEKSSFTEIKLPDGLKEIGNFAFERSSLKELYIPDSVEHIGRFIVSSSSKTKISAVSYNSITSEIETENVTYRDETTELKRAVRLAADIEGKTILTDIDGDGFPELIAIKDSYGYYIYVYSKNSWQRSTYMDDKNGELALYYDSNKKCNVFFVSNLDSYYDSPVFKYYPTKTGFDCETVGETSYYTAYNEHGTNSSYILINAYENIYDTFEYNKSTDIDYSENLRRVSYEKYIKNYKLVRTININDLLKDSGDNCLIYDGTLKDFPDRSAFPDEVPMDMDITKTSNDFCCYAEKFGADEIKAISENKGLRKLVLIGNEFDLNGIEKLDNICEVVINARTVKNGEKLGEMKNLKVLQVIAMQDISFASKLENITVFVATTYSYFSYSDYDFNYPKNYFEPIYKLENLHFLASNMIADFYYDGYYENQYEFYTAIEENMPWLKICNYYMY